MRTALSAAVIVREIDAANATLLVQAYNFTSPPIIQALGRAKDRGVDVRAILDRSNEQPRYTGATYLANHGIPVLIDDRVAIAHNKVMIIDGQTVITGSFNPAYPVCCQSTKASPRTPSF